MNTFAQDRRMTSSAQITTLSIVAAVALLGLTTLALIPSGRVTQGQVPTLLQCSDSDGGINPFQRGTVYAWADSGNMLFGSDVCYGALDVYEFFCRSGVLQSSVITCPGVTTCEAGACA